MSVQENSGLTMKVWSTFLYRKRSYVISRNLSWCGVEQDRWHVCRLCETLDRLPHDSLVGSWSCHWDEWKQIYDQLTAPEFHDLSLMDMTMKCLYGLQQPIRPIAYKKDTNVHSYIFKAGTKYYYWRPDLEQLMQLDGTFTDENVLRDWAALEWDGAELEPDYDGIEKQREREMEQRALARQARGSDSP